MRLGQCDTGGGTETCGSPKRPKPVVREWCDCCVPVNRMTSFVYDAYANANLGERAKAVQCDEVKR